MFYPPEGWCETSSQWVHLILFPFIGVGNGSRGFKFTGGLFEILEMFYPPKGLCIAEPNGVHFDLSILLCLERVFALPNLKGVRGLFEMLKMFYPPKGLCKAENRRRSNCFYLCFNFVLGKVYWIFHLAWVIRLFENPRMFYLMGRTGDTGWTVIKSVL